MSGPQKAICAGLLFLAWGALVLAEAAPVEPFVGALRDALIELGVFQAALTNPNKPDWPG